MNHEPTLALASTDEQHSIHRSTPIAAVVSALSFALTACGGGGGGATSASSTPVASTPVTGSGLSGGAASAPTTGSTPVGTPVPVPTEPSTSKAIVTTVPAPTYDLNGPRYAAYTALNNQRSTCGFGLLKQSGTVDVAAQAHADYLKSQALRGEQTSAHSEIEGEPGFTGTTPTDRVRVAGYEGNAGEALSTITSIGANSAQTALVLEDVLSVAPYHAALMFGGFLDMGLGYSEGGIAPYTLIIDLGTAGGSQEPADVSTFPCQGSTASAILTGEIPSPLAGNGWTFPSGPAITVRSPAGKPLTISGATVTGPSGAAELMTVTQANDPNGHLTPTQGYVLIRQPLMTGRCIQSPSAARRGVSGSKGLSILLPSDGGIRD